ncbi:MAG: fibronectin type III domain-containing protein [Bacteroidota bacterium]
MKNRFSWGLVVALVLVSFSTNAQNNLLDTSTWTAGSGSVPGFNQYGPNNTREMDIGPHGTSVLVWKSLANNSNNNDGGWNSDYVTINPASTYRFTVWIKKLNSFDGQAQFGFKALDANDNEATRNMDGSVKTNPYFEVSDTPTLNDWYLFVAYVYGHDYTGDENGLEGTYDTANNRVITGYDSFKFANTAVKSMHRAYLRLTDAPDAQWFYAPAIYEVNGQEPTIQDLVNGPNNMADTQAPMAPTLASTGQSTSTVDLSWSGATDNTAVTGYRLYQDGSAIATLGSVATYQVTGLAASTTYSFTIKALDAAGNESPHSTTASITTDADPGSGGSNPGTSVWTEANTTASYAGEVAIGRSTVPANYKLAVEGNIRAREIRVDTESWPDYVFTKDHDLPTLAEIQKHIQEKGHLPHMPSAKEVEVNGIELGEMNRLLLEKIEELTLYIIELKKENEKQNSIIQELVKPKE